MTEYNLRELQFRTSVEKLVELVRKHPGTSGGQIAMKILSSLAFRVPVSVDLSRISSSFSRSNMDAAVNVIRYRYTCAWPSDIVPDYEILDWINRWNIKYERL